MKKFLRSKSDTNIFFDKESLDLIHENLNKFKVSKSSKSDVKKKVKKSKNSQFVGKKSNIQEGKLNTSLLK
jgi:hypothetical protein